MPIFTKYLSRGEGVEELAKRLASLPYNEMFLEVVGSAGIGALMCPACGKRCGLGLVCPYRPIPPTRHELERWRLELEAHEFAGRSMLATMGSEFDAADRVILDRVSEHSRMLLARIAVVQSGQPVAEA